MNVSETVHAKLSEMGLQYAGISHEPVRTMADCEPNAKRLNAYMPKNLFLTPRNESSFTLCIVRAEAVFHTADISKQLGLSRLSFASPERLMEALRTEPGAISPMGLLFDEERKVRLAIDRSLLTEDMLAFHPCVNTETIALKQDVFQAFLLALGRVPTYIDIHAI